jgi:hypothetical protein
MRNGLAILVAMLIMTGIYYLSINKYSSDCAQNVARLEERCDSLEEEIYIKDIDNGRYEFILELLRERDSIMVDNVLSQVE